MVGTMADVTFASLPMELYPPIIVGLSKADSIALSCVSRAVRSGTCPVLFRSLRIKQFRERRNATGLRPVAEYVRSLTFERAVDVSLRPDAEAELTRLILQTFVSLPGIQLTTLDLRNATPSTIVIFPLTILDSIRELHLSLGPFGDSTVVRSSNHISAFLASCTSLFELNIFETRFERFFRLQASHLRGLLPQTLRTFTCVNPKRFAALIPDMQQLETLSLGTATVFGLFPEQDAVEIVSSTFPDTGSSIRRLNLNVDNLFQATFLKLAPRLSEIQELDIFVPSLKNLCVKQNDDWRNAFGLLTSMKKLSIRTLGRQSRQYYVSEDTDQWRQDEKLIFNCLQLCPALESLCISNISSSIYQYLPFKFSYSVRHDDERHIRDFLRVD